MKKINKKLKLKEQEEQRFAFEYKVDNGYAKETTHLTDISSQMLKKDMTDNDLDDLFYSSMESDFNSKVSFFADDRERSKFVNWAKKQIKKM